MKLHPTEYNLNKISKYYSTSKSSDMLIKLQNVTLCEQSDFYSAIKYANLSFLHILSLCGGKPYEKTNSIHR